LLFWQACPISLPSRANESQPTGNTFVISIQKSALSTDRQLQATKNNPPVTFWPVTVVIVNTVSWYCYSIQLQMASSDLANYITVKVECYCCPCAHYGCFSL
jgi:hypothetical protein